VKISPVGALASEYYVTMAKLKTLMSRFIVTLSGTVQLAIMFWLPW